MRRRETQSGMSFILHDTEGNFQVWGGMSDWFRGKNHELTFRYSKSKRVVGQSCRYSAGRRLGTDPVRKSEGLRASHHGSPCRAERRNGWNTEVNLLHRPEASRKATKEEQKVKHEIRHK